MSMPIERLPEWKRNQFNDPQRYMHSRQWDHTVRVRDAMHDENLFVIREYPDQDGAYALFVRWGKKFCYRINSYKLVLHDEDFTDQLFTHMLFWKNWRNEAADLFEDGERRRESLEEFRYYEEMQRIKEETLSAATNPIVMGGKQIFIPGVSPGKTKEFVSVGE